MKKKICFFVGSRANYGRLKMLIEETIETYDVKIILGSQGVNIDDRYNEFRDYVAFKIDGLMSNDTHSNMVFTTSMIAEHTSNYLKDNKPDLCFVHGDRYETLGFAMSAAYNNIPLAHTEGGEKSGCIDDKVRNAITALADIHFITTESAGSCLIGRKKVFVVGSTAIDYVASLDLRTPENLKPYGLVLFNPNTTKKESPLFLFHVVSKLYEDINIVWVNANVDPGSRFVNKTAHSHGIKFVKNLPPEIFYTYLYNCNFFLGNSSSGIKEAAYLGVPYICIGDRQKHRECAENCIRMNFNINDVYYVCKKYISSIYRFPKSDLFGNGLASKKIVMILNKLFKEGKI